MRETTCSDCQNNVPLAEAFDLPDCTICQPCLEAALDSGKLEGLTADDVSRCVDPTVCVECQADNGDSEWRTIAELPVCDTCESFFRNRPFPGWLKVASVVFLIVTAVAFAHNWRFFMAYVESLRGHRALAEGRFDEGVTLLVSAGNRVPEIPEVGYVGKFLRAQSLINDDPNEALALLDEIRSTTPSDIQQAFDETYLWTEMSLAFDQENYDRFLAKARSIATLAPDSPNAVASVASGLACKYATTGREAYRRQALEKLAEAEELVDEETAPGFRNYQNRIRHRLATREILSSEEFADRFPDGWQEEDAE